jgi:uncharacterized protein (TIRG00374 family)
LHQKVDFMSVGRVLKGARLEYVLLAVCLNWLPIPISSVRWGILLNTLGIRVPIRALASITHIAQFFTVLVPGVAGEDGTRFFYISRLAPDRVKQGCSTVLVDRALGIVSLFALAGVCIPMNWSVLASQPATRWLGVGFFSVGAGLLVFSFTFLVCKRAFLVRFCARIKCRFARFSWLAELADVAAAFAGNRRRLCAVAGGAAWTHIMLCCGFWSAGRAVGIELPLWFWMSFVPVILVAGVIPVTFAGIGVRDYLLFLFIGSTAGAVARADQIAALSMLILFSTLLFSALGGLVYLVYRAPSKGSAESEVAVDLKQG